MRYRAAILAQFPSLSVGFIRARDTADIHTSGLGVSLSLPIFSRNRGPIAIEQATRQRLHEACTAATNVGPYEDAPVELTSTASGARLRQGPRLTENASGP